MSLGRVQGLSGIRLNSRAPRALAAFFEGLGFCADKSDGPAAGRPVLSLGGVGLELARVADDARGYPDTLAPWSPLFQHFAVVVSDMDAARARLDQIAGWSAITQGPAQRLPANTGGVTAFKFRDPEGHPLELLALPATHAPSCDALFQRIDHSAISVADTAASIAFYRSLGLTPGARSLNQGIEQARLDGLPGARVAVTALDFAAGPAPHLELLCYEGEPRRRGPAAGIGDIAATRLRLRVDAASTLHAIRARHAHRVVAADRADAVLLRDPDGHLLQLECARVSAAGSPNSPARAP
jgi:catechol 2,3-dioxygenase-like lactoylglutathione lyase family enzyme